MPVKSVRLYTLALIISDALAILGSFSFAYIVRVQLDERPLLTAISSGDFFGTFLVLTPFWLIAFAGLGLYSPRVYNKRLTEMGKLIIGACLGILIVLGYAFIVNQPIFPARLVAVYALIIMFVLLVVGREVLRQVRDLLYRFGVGTARVMIIGSSDMTYDIAQSLHNSRHSGYRVVAIVGNRRLLSDARSYRSLPTALSELSTYHVDTIIQTELYADVDRNRDIMAAAQEHHIQYCFIPGEAEFYSGKNQIDVFLGYPIINVYQTPLVGWGEVIKRIFDLVVALVTLPVWGSLLVIVALLQKLFNPGPIFYKSDRMTRYSKHFKLLKFRSMGAAYGKHDAAEEFRTMGREDLALMYERDRKVPNDPRITWFGKFLRMTSLDEIPQIINVLTGDLSLVGPRPILPQELPFYKGRGALLHSVKSGVTGLWQVSGRSNLAFEKRVELELYYAQNWSFWLDVKILFKTIGVVLFHQGAK